MLVNKNFLTLLLTTESADLSKDLSTSQELFIFLAKYSFLLPDTPPENDFSKRQLPPPGDMSTQNSNGARYLDPKYSRWLSTDPALSSYVEKNYEGPSGGIYNSVNLNLYHYGGNNPIRYVDPDGREGIPYLEYKKKVAQEIRNWDPKNIKFTFSEQINKYEYYDENGNKILIGVSIPDERETIGDALSSCSLLLNFANVGCTVTGQLPIAEFCGIGAGLCDFLATIFYSLSGNWGKASISLIGFGVDLIPSLAYMVKPSLEPGFNISANRFINPSTSRFVTNDIGLRNYLLPPTTSITYGVGSNIYINEKEKEDEF